MPTLDDLLAAWQEAPETPPEDICRLHPELLAELLDRIAILRQIECLAEGEDSVPYMPTLPAVPPARPPRDP